MFKCHFDNSGSWINSNSSPNPLIFRTLRVQVTVSLTFFVPLKCAARSTKRYEFTRTVFYTHFRLWNISDVIPLFRNQFVRRVLPPPRPPTPPPRFCSPSRVCTGIKVFKGDFHEWLAVIVGTDCTQRRFLLKNGLLSNGVVTFHDDKAVGGDKRPRRPQTFSSSIARSAFF